MKKLLLLAILTLFSIGAFAQETFIGKKEAFVVDKVQESIVLMGATMLADSARGPFYDEQRHLLTITYIIFWDGTIRFMIYGFKNDECVNMTQYFVLYSTILNRDDVYNEFTQSNRDKGYRTDGVYWYYTADNIRLKEKIFKTTFNNYPAVGTVTTKE